MENANYTVATQDGLREAKPAMLRGWRGKCPNCGMGPMFIGYLKVRNTCEFCSEDLYHHRADDGPAYIAILVCGHLLAPIMMIVFETWRPDPIVLTVGFVVVFVALALYLLPRIKGVIVALQWAKQMHGFRRDVAQHSID